MQGLSSKVAKQKQKQYGKNVLQVKKAHPWWKMLLGQFLDVFVVILLAASGVSYFLGEETDSLVILCIVLLNAGIGFFQEFRTERTLEALKKMIHPQIRVLRDGREMMLETELLVPGDIVILGEGDKIPADGKLVEVHSLKVEESALTGESLPIEKEKDEEVFMGTSVVRGSGILEVVSTGMSTKFGEIAKLTTETEKVKSPLQKELGHMGMFVTKITFFICGLLFLMGIWRGDSTLESLLFSVSVAIAAVPEGLPTTITIALALGASVLARKKAIVKKLSSVETLGAVTTICSDKTGTLTKNEMTVREIYLADRSIFHVSGVGYDPHSGSIDFVGGDKAHKENKGLRDKLLQICARCNEAKLVHAHHQYRVLGDPTEGALLTLAQKGKLDPEKLQKQSDEIFPFDSDRKMMSVIAEKKVLVKGSPDQVLRHCTHFTDGTKLYRMTPQKRAMIQKHYHRMASNAYRVLAFAERAVAKNEKNITAHQAEKNLVFVGLVGMIDPPREEVKKAVTMCYTAGIRTIIITGDYGVTAEAVARELGMIRAGEVLVLTGEETKTLSDKKLKQLLKDKQKTVIFARSLPEQKMRIVSLLQEQGEIVAMTGDGVNDAPALKKADIGIAMGITGTDVSKEASPMILTDDSFASIVTAVREGRRIYNNLQKFVWFIFSCNVGELVVVFGAILFQYPMPLTAILILCIDLGTDILPAIALGVDEPEPRLMHRAPRSPKARLMNQRFIRSFLVVGFAIGLSVTWAFLWTVSHDGWIAGEPLTVDVRHGVTVAFVSLVFVQLVNTFSARSSYRSVFRQNPFSNAFLVVAILSSILMVLLMIYVPFLNEALKTVPLEKSDWWIVGVASLIPLIVVEMQKAFVRVRTLEG